MLRLDEKTTVPLYDSQLAHATKAMIRVVVSETISVLPRHTMTFPMHIKDWKPSINESVATFELYELSDGACILFDYAGKPPQ